MVIYIFLLEFFSPYNQNHVTSKSRAYDQKTINTHTNMYYIAKTSKVQKNKFI